MTWKDNQPPEQTQDTWEKEIDEWFNQMLDEPTEPGIDPKCTCGCAKVYGDKYPLEHHPDYCDAKKHAERLSLPIYDQDQFE